MMVSSNSAGADGFSTSTPRIRPEGGLLTLGGLCLEGSGFSRTKPLLLLAYLALEGPQSRLHLAELFFSEARDPRDSLSSALRHLRKAGIALEGERLNFDLPCDALTLEAHLKAGQLEAAVTSYGGAFLQGLDLTICGSELEEWVLERRERLAEGVRTAHLKQAEALAHAGNFSEGAQQALRVLEVLPPGVLGPEELRRLYALFRAAEHPRAHQLEREAMELGLTLSLEPVEARARLRLRLLGREAEERILQELMPGQWCWIWGGEGMGKSALLERLPAIPLPACSLPYMTLEPLLEGATSDTARLERLERKDWLILDGWERTDAESRRLLGLLRSRQGAVKVVIVARIPPTVRVERSLELGPLGAGALEHIPGLFEATGGLPTLVAAHLQGQSLEGAISALLSGRNPLEREVFAALCLCPDPTCVREALALSAAHFSEALEGLRGCGLLDPEGCPRVLALAFRLLESHPEDHGPLALLLARIALGERALALYHQGRLHWEDRDHARAQKLGLEQSRVQATSGLLEQALETLNLLPASLQSDAERVRLLERLGRYPQALRLLDALETPLHALRAALAYRQGQPELAAQQAHRALEGPPLERAEARWVLGNLALDAGKLEAAEGHLRASAALYLMLGDLERRGEALLCLAIVRAEGGDNAERAFQAVLDASDCFPKLRCKALSNLGRVFDSRGDPQGAEGFYLLALEGAGGYPDLSAKLWTNLGVLHHRAGRTSEALSAYLQALEAAQQSRELVVQANALANIGTLNGDLEALEEGIRLLEGLGHRGAAEFHLERLRALRQP